MRNIILGSVAGLLIGSVGALAYSHFAGDGNDLADLKAKLDDADAKLAKTQADMKFLREQYNSETDQLNHVLASKQEQPASTDGTPVAAAAPALNPLTVGGVAITPDMVRGFLAMAGRGGPGGFRSPEQRAFLFQSRLKLNPDQAKAIKDAMDADQKARRDAFRQARQNGGQVDPAAMAAANSLDKTMATVLSPTQQLQYQQLQSDEKQARAETQATQQVDNMMPLLQLSDDQKSKLMNALYQQQLTSPDLGGPGGPGGPGGFGNGQNPLNALAQQGQAVSTAMKSVLSSDQYALYQQNEQVQAQGMQNFGGGQGGGNGRRNRADANGQAQTVSGGGAAATPAATLSTGTSATGTSTTGTSTSATGTTTVTGTTTTDSTSTTTPSATTNAASGTPPAN